MRELDPASLELGGAVEDVAGVEVGPAGHGRGEEPAIAGGGREIEDFLAGRPDSRADYLREQLGQPRPGGEHEPIGADGLARCQPNLVEPVAGCARRFRETLHISPARADEAVDQGLDRPSRHQHSKTRFVKSDLDPGEIDHREALLHLAPAELVDPEPKLAMDLDRSGEIIVALVAEEQDARTDEDRQSRNVAQRLPLRQTVPGHSGIDGIAAVSGPGQARFAARRSAAVRRCERIDQGDVFALLPQVVRGPRAEYTGADHRDVFTGCALCHRRPPSAE